MPRTGQTRAGSRAAGGPGRSDAGVTLIELAVAVVVLAILIGLTNTGWGRYRESQEAVSASGEVVSVLRNAQMRATAEATTYRVDVDPVARTLTVHRYDGAGYVQRARTTLGGGSLRVDEASFSDKTGAVTTSAYFYPRGTASPGRVVVGREGSGTPRVITIEGLTGRVSTT